MILDHQELGTLKLLSVVVFFLTLSQSNATQAINLLKNGGFERKIDISQKGKFCQNWPVTFGSRAKQCRAELSSDAYKDKYSLKLILKGSRKNADMWTGQKIKVTPRTKLNFKLYAKGTGVFYIQFMTIAGKKNSKSTYLPYSLSSKWTVISGNYTIPENVNYVNCLIHMVGRPGEGYFDEFELTLAADSTLSNKRIALNINSLVGGCIDSFIDKRDGFNYTSGRQPNKAGGMGIDILPGDQYPGIFANSLYKNEVIVPYKKIRVSRTINSGKWSGLNICKTYSLPSENKAEAEINVEVKNQSEKSLAFIYRVQNVINSGKGIFSYPSRDWLTVFNRTPETIRTVNSLVLGDLRAGWCAKEYKNHKTLLFKFNNNAVYKIYNYLVKEFDTMEWYYNKINLKPNESWQTKYSITLVGSKGEPYTGKLKYKTAPVHIKGIKLPPPQKTQKILPPIMQGYFPYGAALSSVVLAEAAGSNHSKRLYTYQRQVRELADSYFNNFYFVHLFDGSLNLVEPLGQEARLYDMTMTLNMAIVHKKDVDIEKYRVKMQKTFKRRFKPEILRQSIKKYKDLILCYYTADEIRAMNINCMLLGHDMLRQKLDPDGAFFPYLNLSHSIYDVAKYLPIYLGDIYPIYQAESLTRNPWAVANAIKKVAKKLPDTPIWLMPQAFGSLKNIYGLPTQSEMRLMVYSAVATGAKGIIMYGLNGASSWLVKSGGEGMPIMTAEGARLPQWEAIRECGRELTAIGPRLFYTAPELDYRDARISSVNISKKSWNAKVYEGPALTVNSLKNKNSNVRYLVVVNQDDTNKQSGNLSFRGKAKNFSCYDLTKMKYVKTTEKLKITLRPGDAKFLILGSEVDIKPEIEQIFTNRYQREKTRYIIASERAGKNGIEVDSVPDGSGEIAYKAIIAAQYKLQKTLEKTQFGQMLKQREKARDLLGKVDFALKSKLDSLFSSTVRGKTPHFKKYPKPADPILRNLLECIERDFFDYWKLDRAIENGEYEENKKQIQELIKRISVDTQKMIEYLKKQNSFKYKVKLIGQEG